MDHRSRSASTDQLAQGTQRGPGSALVLRCRPRAEHNQGRERPGSLALGLPPLGTPTHNSMFAGSPPNIARQPHRGRPKRYYCKDRFYCYKDRIYCCNNRHPTRPGTVHYSTTKSPLTSINANQQINPPDLRFYRGDWRRPSGIYAVQSVSDRWAPPRFLSCTPSRPHGLTRNRVNAMRETFFAKRPQVCGFAGGLGLLTFLPGFAGVCWELGGG